MEDYLKKNVPKNEFLTNEELHKKLVLTDVYTSFQGEGKNIGKASVFVRLGNCNLQCIWCDVKYTWLFNQSTLHKLETKNIDDSYDLPETAYDKNKELQEMTVYELTLLLDKKLKENNIKNIVITGGEPLLQQKNLNVLIKALINLYSKENPNYDKNPLLFEIETNGTIMPNEFLLRHKHVFFAVSPKLSNSMIDETRRIKPNVLIEFSKHERTIFKFVITKIVKDLREIKQLQLNYAIPKHKIYLVREGNTTDSQLDAAACRVSEMAIKNGFIYSPRLHILIYNGKRGV